tara:strand:- start:249 stop:422 length:174 start_codon:yes stop_codon:yes gene_type:complete
MSDKTIENLLDTIKFLYGALHYVKEIDPEMWKRANQFASDNQPDLSIQFEEADDDED